MLVKQILADMQQDVCILCLYDTVHTVLLIRTCQISPLREIIKPEAYMYSSLFHRRLLKSVAARLLASILRITSHVGACRASPKRLGVRHFCSRVVSLLLEADIEEVADRELPLTRLAITLHWRRAPSKQTNIVHQHCHQHRMVCSRSSGAR